MWLIHNNFREQGFHAFAVCKYLQKVHKAAHA